MNKLKKVLKFTLLLAATLAGTLAISYPEAYEDLSYLLQAMWAAL